MGRGPLAVTGEEKEHEFNNRSQGIMYRKNAESKMINQCGTIFTKIIFFRTLRQNESQEIKRVAFETHPQKDQTAAIDIEPAGSAQRT